MNSILEKIKSRGYWRINFEPLVYTKKLKTLTECKDIVEKNSVTLRGWDYPHIPRKKEGEIGMFAQENYYEGREDWANHKEVWRMYQSGQFLHFLSLRDDWMEFSGWGITPNRTDIKPGTQLNLIGEVIYELTEIFEFLSRLAQIGLYDEGTRVSITLNNTKGRKLVTSADRWLWDEYITDMENIPFEHEYSKEELITKSKDLALEAIVHIFERFNWPNIPIDVIKSDQEKLLSRNLH
jgi:hypothetical protein